MASKKLITIDLEDKKSVESIYLLDGITETTSAKILEFLEEGNTFKNDDAFFSFLKENNVSERYLKVIRKNVTLKQKKKEPADISTNRCVNIYELKVFLKKIEYSGETIGKQLIFDFLSDDGKYSLDFRGEELLDVNEPVIYHEEHLVYYKRLEEDQLPHHVKIWTDITEKDKITDDRSKELVFTEGYLVDESALEKPITYHIEAAVYEDSNPRDNQAFFKCTFQAFLTQICVPIPQDKPKLKGKPTPSPYDEFFNYLQHEPLLSDNSEVLAFVSDLHIGADKCLDDFSVEDEQLFVNMLKSLSAIPSKSKELILLGDTLELWETAPHYQASEGYVPKTDKIKTKIDKIVLKHQALFDGLAAFSATIPTTYIFGNHDDELLEGSLKGHFISVSGFNGGFKSNYEQPSFNVFAQHGHAFDPKNFTKSPLTDPPIGKWIVENLVVPLEKIKAANGQNCGRFGDIDGFMHSSQFAEHMQCLIKKQLIPTDLQQQLNELLDNASKNTPLIGFEGFLQDVITLINKIKNVGGSDALEQFKDLSKFIERFKLGISVTEKDYQGIIPNKGRGCALMGHTHGQFVKPIDPYTVHVNTGTWQDKFMIEESDPCRRIGMDSRQLTLLIKGKNRNLSEIRGEEIDKGAPIVKIYQYSVFPNGTKQIGTALYIVQ